MITQHQRHWGANQWAAYFKDKDIPVLPATRELIVALRNRSGAESEELSSRELTSLIPNDPYLAVKLLQRVERERSKWLGNDTTTQLAAVLQTGVEELYTLIAGSEVVSPSHTGWNVCVSTAVLAASIANAWASLRADVSPEEVSLAALLSEIGELLMWHYHPELPIKAIEEFAAGRATRTAAAQEQAIGFTFKALTIALAESWQLPALIGQLMRGVDSPRANIARISLDAARHIEQDYDNAALPTDICNIHKILPGITDERLIAALPLSSSHRNRLIAAMRLNGEDRAV